MRLRNLLFVLLLCMTVGIFSACTGDDGAQGPAGPQGPQGEQGPPGMDASSPEETSEEGCEDFVERIRFNGTSGDDIICGNERTNVINGEEGDDIIFGREGNDTLHGNPGDDTLHGGVGNDTLRGDEGNDVLNGDAGKDDLDGGNGDDVMDGGEGDDTLWSFANTDGSDDFIGGDGTDVVDFSRLGLADPALPQSDTNACGSPAPAVTISLATGYTEFGNPVTATDYYEGIENLTGTCGADTLTGDAGDNTINGGTGDDTINGGAGDDTINAGADQSAGTLNGGEGMDILVVSATATLNATGGIDTNSEGFENLTDGSADGNVALTGNGQANVLTGGAGANTLNGGEGDDTLNGKGGADPLTGGAGKDTFIIAMGEGADSITDFDLGDASGPVDMIYLKGFPSGSELGSVQGDDDGIGVGGTLVFSVQDASTATNILRSPSTYVKFVD